MRKLQTVVYCLKEGIASHFWGATSQNDQINIQTVTKDIHTFEKESEGFSQVGFQNSYLIYYLFKIHIYIHINNGILNTFSNTCNYRSIVCLEI